MSDVLSLLARCQELGAELTPTTKGTLKVSSPTPLPEALRAELKRRKPELLRLLSQRPQPGNRDFLSRPLGQENNPDPWDAWAGFMLWLLEHHPEHYHHICNAEDAINALEREGITHGPRYENACRELLIRFETARRLKLKAQVKAWIQ